VPAHDPGAADGAGRAWGWAAGIGIQAVSLAGRLATITERADAALLARKLARPAATAV